MKLFNLLLTPRTALLLAAAALLLIEPLTAQPGPRETWLTAKSGPFTVYSNAKPGKTRDILLALEQLRAVIDALSPAEETNERPTFLYAFASQRLVAPYFSTPPRPDVIHMTEYFVGPAATHIVLNAAETPSDVLPWVYRAYLGQDLLRRFPDLPLWARSGLGHFYATLEVERKGTVRIGRPDKSHLELLRGMNWIPLEQFFGVDRNSPVMRSTWSRQVFEAQAWLLTHFLMTATPEAGSNVRPSSAFFTALESGLTPEDAIQRVFGLGLRQLESRLRGYSRGATMSYFTVTIDGMPRGLYELEAVSRDEMSLLLGQHLVRSHVPPPVESAERHLEPLFDSPTFGGDALAAVADLRQKSGRMADAEALYRRAVAAEPRQAVSWLNQAIFQADQGASLAPRRSALERALELDPTLGEGWARLAQTYQESSAADYALHLERAVHLMPERADLAYNLAMAHLRAGDAATARRVAEHYLRNPDHRKLASDAQREIARFEAVQASNDALESGDLDAAVSGLEAALEDAADPAVRAQLRSSIERLKSEQDRTRRIADYSAAVALLNEGRTTEAEEQLAALLPSVIDPSLKSTIERLLTEIRSRR